MNTWRYSYVEGSGILAAGCQTRQLDRSEDDTTPRPQLQLLARLSMHVQQARTRTHTQHMPKYTRGWPHWPEQTDAHTDSTNSLILFPSLTHQGEGSLLGNTYTHVDPPVAGSAFTSSCPQTPVSPAASTWTYEPLLHRPLQTPSHLLWTPVTGGLTLDHRSRALSGSWPGPLAPPAAIALSGLTLRDAHMPGSQATSPTPVWSLLAITHSDWVLAPWTRRPSKQWSGSRHWHIHRDTCMQSSVPSPGKQLQTLTMTRDRLHWLAAGHCQTRVQSRPVYAGSALFIPLPFYFPHICSCPNGTETPLNVPQSPNAHPVPLQPAREPASHRYVQMGITLGPQATAPQIALGSFLCTGYQCSPTCQCLCAPWHARVWRQACMSWLLSCSGPGSSRVSISPRFLTHCSLMHTRADRLLKHIT